MNLIGNRYEVLNFNKKHKTNKMYKARDVYENEYVFIKIIKHNEYIINEKFIPNLIDENTMIDGLNSNYILKIKDVGIHCTETEVFYYMVSDYFKSVSLETLISTNNINTSTLASISMQVSKALEVAHRQNIYHGDLNPENILIDDNNNVKVCNFGIVQANQGINLRINDEIKYLSPYQISLDYTDLQSDLFSLGVMLYKAVFKRLPYDNYKNEEELLKCIDKGVNFIYLDISNKNKYIVDIIKRLIDRKDKYENIQELIIDLTLIMYKNEVYKNKNKDIEINNKELIEENKPQNKSKSKKIAGVFVIMVITIIYLIN